VVMDPVVCNYTIPAEYKLAGTAADPDFNEVQTI
jgi:hypothetical protein